MLRIKYVFIAVLCLFSLGIVYSLDAKAQKKKSNKNAKTDITVSTSAAKRQEATKVTFVELGSVKCIPCKAMQPIIKEIEEEYGNKGVKVLFYDVWTEAGRPYAEQYRVTAIPTQVFLDKDGREFFRHMGFFPKDEILKILEKQGVK